MKQIAIIAAAILAAVEVRNRTGLGEPLESGQRTALLAVGLAAAAGLSEAERRDAYSLALLKNVGCEYCVVGHSERRQFFGETNETVNKKARALLASGLKPIVCVGEKLEERKANKAFQVVKDHVANSLAGLTKEDMRNVVIAYEPVWAIGTGINATKEQAQEIHAYIRGLLREMFDETVSKSVRIQYGGSVKPENIKELISQEDVDGALVGGASLKADSFAQIVRNCL